MKTTFFLSHSPPSPVLTPLCLTAPPGPQSKKQLSKKDNPSSCSQLSWDGAVSQPSQKVSGHLSSANRDWVCPFFYFGPVWGMNSALGGSGRTGFPQSPFTHRLGGRESPLALQLQTVSCSTLLVFFLLLGQSPEAEGQALLSTVHFCPTSGLQKYVLSPNPAKPSQ